MRNFKNTANSAEPSLFVKNRRNHKIHSANEASLKTLSCVLTWLGIGTSEDSNILVKFLYIVVAHVMVLDIVVSFCIDTVFISDGATLNLAYEMLSVASLILWHALYRRKRLLHKTLHTLQHVLNNYSMTFVKRNFIIVTLILNITLLLIFASALTYVTSVDKYHEYCSILYYHMQEECSQTFIALLYTFAKSLLINAMCPFFSIFISVLYSCVCCRCSALLLKYRSDIIQIMSTEKYYMVNPELGRRYIQLLKLVDEVQNLFSLPSLLIFSINIIQLFLLFARFMTNFVEEVTSELVVEHICLRIPSCILALVVFACAAQVSTEMKKNNVVFHSLHEKMVFNLTSEISPENLQVATALKLALPITLSAGEMIEFSGNTIPAAVGAFLTYALLFLSLDSKN